MVAEFISSTLLSIALIIAAIKKKVIIAIAIIVMAIGFLTLLRFL